MNNDLFFEPKTTQYGSHMVMSNVYKPIKNKYINIDTRFREEYNYSQTIDYNITLPERLTDIKSMRVVSAEIPISFYNISTALGNNFFNLTDTNGANIMITIPDGQYTLSSLSTKINGIISTTYSSTNLSYTSSTGYSSFTALNNKTITLNFAVNSDGTADKFNFKSKLGWILGYRNPSYTIIAATPSKATVISEGLVDINGPRYLYLAIEEFNKGNQYSFIPGLYKSLVNKNIIARITLNNQVFGYGTILPVNNFTGLLSDTRSYTDKIDLLKLNVKLLNESGTVINLNGMDFSFCMEVTHE